MIPKKVKEVEEKIKKIVIGDTGCPVCKYGWKGYRGNYDELCDKHYLQIEPTK
jgi:hypothetical protein